MSNMKVEIWSDVVCPFCYIGKRNFESALTEFDNNAAIDIIWKSFQLSPDLVTSPNKSINEYLTMHKGISIDEAKQMNDYVTQMAANAGLVYNFDKVVVANSFNAHRLCHFAKQKGLQNETEEKLFASYFTLGKNIDDIDTLMAIGIELGLDKHEIKTVLHSNAFTAEVLSDIEEANDLGIRSVPFFVFNRKYAVSGAQGSKAFLQALQTSYATWQKGEKSSE